MTSRPKIDHHRPQTHQKHLLMDILTVNDSETYRLLEVCFKEDMFDGVEVLAACGYRKD